MIVEMHDLTSPGCTELMVKRFRRTHQIDIVPTQERHPQDFPALLSFPENLRVGLLGEGRTQEQVWLRLSPLKRNAPVA